MKIDLQNLLPKPLREVRIARDSLPVTRDDKLLPYEGLDFGQFELFCCELVNRNLENEGPNTKIIRIEPLANDGQSQYGADIFIEKNRNGETWIELIEVKRVKEFTKLELQGTKIHSYILGVTFGRRHQHSKKSLRS